MQNISNIEIKKTTNILRALNHPLRQQIIADIWNAGNIVKVTDLYVKLRIAQPVASQQLAILRRANIINSKRVGKNKFYSVDPAEIDRVNALCKQINNSSKN